MCTHIIQQVFFSKYYMCKSSIMYVLELKFIPINVYIFNFYNHIKTDVTYKITIKVKKKEI